MQQYVFSMTSRMVTIAATCALLLCVLLFVLGIEIGARFSAAAPAASSSTSVAPTTVFNGSVSTPPASQGANDLAAVPASSTL
ncbi:hypothetical protein PQR75_41615 [Paraburkholderia fungorum]|jgi:hypothetical protein|uniref:hypothetical protein n=1 Tax=Paraburkholderia fungorum TaxID=134537 RepID=UPI0038BE15BF